MHVDYIAVGCLLAAGAMALASILLDPGHDPDMDLDDDTEDLARGVGVLPTDVLDREAGR